MHLLFLLVLLACLGCNITKQNPTAKSCKTMATVSDFRGLDGCGFMLILEDGTKLNPVKVSAEEFEFSDQQKVRINYRKAADMMTVCMAENMMIEITCIEEVAAGNTAVKPPDPNCHKVDSPLDLEWLKALYLKYKPYQINRYEDAEGWAYFLMAANKSYLYDCGGNFLCDISKQDSEACNKRMQNLRNKVVIWVENN